jgi:hypothetical protein
MDSRVILSGMIPFGGHPPAGDANSYVTPSEGIGVTPVVRGVEGISARDLRNDEPERTNLG